MPNQDIAVDFNDLGIVGDCWNWHATNPPHELPPDAFRCNRIDCNRDIQPITFGRVTMVGIRRTILLAMLALAATASLASGQDLAPISAPPELVDSQPACESQFERGRPRKVVDALGWTFGIPKKIILWDRRACNHHVSAQTEQSLAEYMAANGLGTTKVRINQYDPVGEWQRLHANQEVGAGWRYTVGAFSTLAYTVFPGRVFGSDRYNPYTDSIYIYSDIPCIAQEQGSYAKLVGSRRHPGTYVAVTSLPVVRLWPQKRIKTDVIDYTLATGTPEQHQEATRILYAEYGAQVGGQASLLVGSNLPFTLVGAGIGHVAARVRKSPTTEPPLTDQTELTASQPSLSSSETLTR